VTSLALAPSSGDKPQVIVRLPPSSAGVSATLVNVGGCGARLSTGAPLAMAPKVVAVILPDQSNAPT